MPFLRTLFVLLLVSIACVAWQAAGRIGALPAIDVVSARMALEPDGGAGGPESLDWQPLDQQVLAGWRGPYWLQWELRGDPGTDAPPGLRLSLRGASEVHWDGRLLGRNGVVGRTVVDEVPGQVDWYAALPIDGDAGAHRLQVRASSQRLGFGVRSADAAFAVGPLDVMLIRQYGRWVVAAIALGALLVSGLYFAAVSRRPAVTQRAGAMRLLMLAAVGVALPVVEAWRPLWGYPYDLHALRLGVLLALNTAAAMLLPAYLAARCGVRVPRTAVVAFGIGVAAAIALVPGFDGRSLLVHLLGLIAALGIVLRARSADRDDAWPIGALLAAMLTLLLVDPAAFLDGLYFIALAVLMVVLLLRHAAHLSALGEANAQLQAQRARLSSQLLQRSIHPHWLMNTLTSLQELIEQAPAHASRMVDLLADEFRRLRGIGESALIPLREEIALCRVHLDIVGLAHGQSIALDVVGDVAGIELPPGLLHAQIENGLTHAGAAACAATGFELRVERSADGVVLTLRSAFGRRSTSAGGTGTRFIEASLEAAFPGRWRYRQHADAGGWHGRIELPCAS